MRYAINSLLLPIFSCLKSIYLLYSVHESSGHPSFIIVKLIDRWVLPSLRQIPNIKIILVSNHSTSRMIKDEFVNLICTRTFGYIWILSFEKCYLLLIPSSKSCQRPVSSWNKMQSRGRPPMVNIKNTGRTQPIGMENDKGNQCSRVDTKDYLMMVMITFWFHLV